MVENLQLPMLYISKQLTQLDWVPDTDFVLTSGVAAGRL